MTCSLMAELIVTVGGTKGGSGKSTHATNAAVLSASEGKRTILIDADDQTSSFDFSMDRSEDHPNAPSYTCVKLTGKAVRSEVLKLAPNYDRIVIDAGGRDTESQRAALTVSNIFMIPIVPSQFDVRTLDKVNSLVDEIRAINPELIAYAFLNEARPKGKGTENNEAIAMIRKRTALTYLDIPIRQFQAYRHAASQGLAITELKRPHKNKDASNELIKLYRRCFDVNVTLDQVAGTG